MIAFLDKLTSTVSVDFDKIEHRLIRLSWTQRRKNDTKHLEIRLKVFRHFKKAHFLKHKSVNLRNSDFKLLLQVRNQIVVAASALAKDESLENNVSHHYP